MAFIRGAQHGWLGDDGHLRRARLPGATVVIVGVIAVLALVFGWIVGPPRRGQGRLGAPRRPEEIDPFAGGYPVPPLPGQRLREPLARRTGPDPPASETKEDARG